MSEAIHVVDLIAKRGMNIDSRFQICGHEGESVNHFLFSCPLTRHIWALSHIPWPPCGFDEVSLFSNIHYCLNMAKCSVIPLEIRRSFPWLLWFIWKNRNGLFFEGNISLATEIVIKAREESELWFFSQSLGSTVDPGMDPVKFRVKKK